MRVGILVHGLFLQAKEWEDIVWGNASKPGSLPKAIEVMLRFGLANIGHVVFGTGASEKDGLKEAEYTRRELANNLLRAIPDRTLSRLELHQIQELLAKATLEMAAKNTAEEVAAAAQHFATHCCDLVVYVPTCASHGARCYKTYQQVRAHGLIPEGQMWLAADPATTFANSKIDDVAIVEPPHRADDPMLAAPVKAHEVVPRLFKLSPADRMKFLVEADALLREKYGV